MIKVQGEKRKKENLLKLNDWNGNLKKNALKRTKLNWKHVRVRGYNFYFNQIYRVSW